PPRTALCRPRAGSSGFAGRKNPRPRSVGDPHVRRGWAHVPGGTPRRTGPEIVTRYCRYRFGAAKWRTSFSQPIHRLPPQAVLAPRALQGTGAVPPANFAQEWLARPRQTTLRAPRSHAPFRTD